MFTDFDMPRMDGMQLIRTIRERSDLAGLPIVMVSSRTAAELEEKAIGKGASCSMVFRAGEQLFAVPMQYIKNAGVEGEQDESEGEIVCPLSQLLGVAKSAGSNLTRLVIEAQPLLAGDGQSRRSFSSSRPG